MIRPGGRLRFCGALLALAVHSRPAAAQTEAKTLTDAYRLFYNAHYEQAAALAE